MKLNLRDLYIDFFVSKGHVQIPSSPVVPENDPLIYYSAVAEYAFKCDSAVYFEINPLLSTQTCEMLMEIGFQEIEIKKDISKKPRMIWAK